MPIPSSSVLALEILGMRSTRNSGSALDQPELNMRRTVTVRSNMLLPLLATLVIAASGQREYMELFLSRCVI